MNYRVVHFEIHAEQPDRAIAFYSGLFGWGFDKWSGPMPYWLMLWFRQLLDADVAEVE
jgi:predicted enzyme related to lactoylglutathione lyase